MIANPPEAVSPGKGLATHVIEIRVWRLQRAKRTVPPSRIENSRPRSAWATTAMIG
jgi:hypothetical protein